MSKSLMAGGRGKQRPYALLAVAAGVCPVVLRTIYVLLLDLLVRRTAGAQCHRVGGF